MSAISIRLLFTLLIAASAISGSSIAEGKRNLTVYFPDYRYKEGVEPKFYGTTHLVLFSAKPNEDGSVDFGRISPEMIEMGKTARIKSSGLKVTYCVGGWGRGKLFANAVSTPENRARFVDSLANYCEENQLDGVDIDWEFPKGDQEHADFTAFLKQLSKRLHAKDRLLTVALGETRPLSAETYTFIDQVNLMSYQPWNPEPYEEWLEKAVQRMLDSGLPPQKLNIGLGFYTKKMGGDRRAVSWSKLAGVDPATAFPASEHSFSPVGKGACDLRLNLVKKHQLGGIMVWDYGHDSMNPDHSLLRHTSGLLNKP